MNIYKTILLTFLPIHVCLCIQGCLPPNHWGHDPPLAHNVPQIVKGQTTRDEILQYFGPPDIEADGANSIVNPNMPIIRMYKELSGWPLYRDAEFPKFTELEKLFPYRSIDDDHVSFVYNELYYHKFKVKFIRYESINMPSVIQEYFNNRLLILINKETGIVDEFYYREEFRTD